MKRTVYIAAFLLFVGTAIKAQTKVADQKSPAQDQVNPDGTLKQQPAKEKEKKKEDNTGTRMAITDKGVPTSKPKTAAKTTSTQPADKKAATTEGGNTDKK